MIGTMLAHFRVVDKLGEGGMGEVYRAQDTKLGREVAIKVLPEAVAGNPERLARFEREAKVLAALNHSNIAAIYSLESAERAGTEASPYKDSATTVNFLVMELADGEDLADRIARGPIPVEETLSIAFQIAEALEAAHERGIIHRDLKPANIKVDDEGRVKVLDFGLAKALDPTEDLEGKSFEGQRISASLSPTLTAQMTSAGVILGTAAYMSPEQAKGKTVDKRSDIWAFGVMLFEMLAGRKLFEAESVPETLGAIFQQEIDLDELPANTPRKLRRLLNRCLDRDSKSRLRDIGEARLAIQATIEGDDSVSTEHLDSPAIKGTSGPFLVATLVVGLLLGTLITWLLRPQPASEVVKLEVPTEHLRASRVQHPMISPDGRMVLVPETRGLMVRRLDAMSGRWIPDSTGARYPCWSPDSQSIAFAMGIEIRKVSVQGGSPTPVAKLPADVGGSGGMVWTTTDHLLVAGGDRSGIMQVSVQGGEFKEIVPLDKEQEVDFHEIALLPNEKGLAYIVHRQDPASQHRLVDSIGIFANGERREVLRLEGESILSVAYSPPGYLLFHQSTSTPGVWALPFSLKELKATGEPFLVAADSWLPSVSDDGTLLLVHGLKETLNEVVELDREGNLLRTIAQIQSDGEAPHLSPDYTRLTLSAIDSGNWDIWIYDLERGTRTRLTFDSTFDVNGRWSPSGDEILYSVADVRQLRLMRVDGTGKARTVGEGLAPDWIPDGSGFMFEHYSDETDSWNVSYKRFSEDEAVPLLATPANEVSPRVSPDGLYFLYVSDETGNWEVLARSFPDGEKKWQISTAGGSQPQWSPTGREIFYVEGGSLVAVALVDSDTFTLGIPTKLLQVDLSLSVLDPARFNTYAPGPDGQSLFLVRPASDGASVSRLMLIQSWQKEFGDRD